MPAAVLVAYANLYVLYPGYFSKKICALWHSRPVTPAGSLPVQQGP